MGVLRAAKPLSTPPLSPFADGEGQLRSVAEQLPLRPSILR